MKLFFTIIFLTTFILLFLFPHTATSYAKEGLYIWMQNVLPSLYPFMILQSVFIQLKYDEFLGKLLKPVMKYLFPLSECAYFAIPLGFLCGFPMGAIVTTKLYQGKKLNKKEAELLLSFCNNIGPVYTLTMILPIFPKEYHLFILFLMYGIPFLYGSLLSHLLHKRKKEFYETKKENNIVKTQKETIEKSFCSIFFSAVKQAGESILTLGGCMIFFSILRIFLEIIPNDTPLLQCIGTGSIEVGSFVQVLSENISLFSYGESILILSGVITGGLSCFMQTCSIIEGTDLSINKYLFHKCIQTLLWIFIGTIRFFLIS